MSEKGIYANRAITYEEYQALPFTFLERYTMWGIQIAIFGFLYLLIQLI